MVLSEPPSETKNILAGLAGATAFYAASVGVSLEQIAKTTGVSPAALMNPDARIPQSFFLDVLRLLHEERPDHNISLELALAVPVSFPGSPWRLMTQSPNLHTTLKLMVQHSDLFADQLEFELVESDAETILRVSHPFDEIDGGLGGEFIMALGVRVFRANFGKEVIARLQFRNAARSPESVYNEFFGIPLTFCADFNGFVFLPEALESSGTRALPEMQGSPDSALSLLRHEMGVENSDDLVDVRLAVAKNAMAGDFSVSGLADRMAIGTRNLQRRLRASGQSARSLLDEARYGKAMELLAYERMSIENIAIRLGYKSERGFRKAFQRWSGRSPAQARREMG